MGLKRIVLTSEAGEYLVPALIPGVYDVTADSAGFKQIVREATVEAGSTTDVSLVMQVGASTESPSPIEGASPQIQYESHEVDGQDYASSNRRHCLSTEGIIWSSSSSNQVRKRRKRVSTNRILMPLLGSPVALTDAQRGSRSTVAA